MLSKAFVYALLALALCVGNDSSVGAAADDADTGVIRRQDRMMRSLRARERRNRLRLGRNLAANPTSFDYEGSSVSYDDSNVTVAENVTADATGTNTTTVTLDATDTFEFIPAAP